MALQFTTPTMPQPTFPWSSPDPFAMRTAPSAPQAPPPASTRRRTGSRTSSKSPKEDDTNNSFKFVTATRPDEFKDPELMRTVRSHVMFGVVEGRQRVTPRAKKPLAAPASTSSSFPVAPAQKRTPTLRRADSAADSNPENPQIMAREEALDIFQRYRHLYFGTRGMARAWLPQMIQSRESFLSTLAIATSHQDAMAGMPTPTTLTTMVQTEVMHLLREAFNERWYRIKDTTIMTVVQLLCSELVNCSGAADRLVSHERGLRQLIIERGGIDRLGLQGELAGVATAMVYSSAIFREGVPDAMFSEYANTVRPSVYSDRQIVPESPLFCPRKRFATLERSRRCDARTLELVGKMKELVDLVDSPLEQSTWDTESYKRGILDYFRGLPPAGALPVPSTDVGRQARWRYEACRLAAILHAESLVNRRPLSSLPLEARSTTTPASERSTGDAPEAVSLERLVAAVKRSDCGFAECWTDMTGLLYWVTLVGGAAARNEEEATQRRWLTALNVSVFVN
ncbi:hypothetical protein UCDDS831_g05639 [Diplodia seriata]|uniref:Tachykinin family protein n=1 Tax=Diplodia seriata TaxID=420778 RepID=A0A0G2E7L6_9PEZI|nr:hypothetical protein UCDDS831_g05639 [Diplodia seriata]